MKRIDFISSMYRVGEVSTSFNFWGCSAIFPPLGVFFIPQGDDGVVRQVGESSLGRPLKVVDPVPSHAFSDEIRPVFHPCSPATGLHVSCRTCLRSGSRPKGRP